MSSNNKEIWRDIKGYEGLYQISNLGRVKSLNYNRSKKEKVLKPGKCRGYLLVRLVKNKNTNTFQVHRLVAEAFIENPECYSQVNHKDEDKTNNKVENLEWCTPKYNSNYGTRNKRLSEKLKGREFTENSKRKISQNHADFSGSKNGRARKVQCITTGKVFTCIQEGAEYYYINRNGISACCVGRQKTGGRYNEN